MLESEGSTLFDLQLSRMETTHNLKPEDLKEGQEFWDLYRDVMQSKGVDISGLYLAAVEDVKQKLALPGARTDFLELTSVGCSPVVLSLLVALIRYSPSLKEFWERSVGRAHERQRAKRDLERAAARLERIFASTLNADDKTKEKLARNKLLLPSELISHLRLYIRLIALGERLAAGPGLRSLSEFTKYLLVGYVKRATGKFCDRNVSGLLACLVGPHSYDEVAQRMWRRRNYGRLETHLRGLADILRAMDIVISGKTKT